MYSSGFLITAARERPAINGATISHLFSLLAEMRARQRCGRAEALLRIIRRIFQQLPESRLDLAIVLDAEFPRSPAARPAPPPAGDCKDTQPALNHPAAGRGSRAAWPSNRPAPLERPTSAPGRPTGDSPPGPRMFSGTCLVSALSNCCTRPWRQPSRLASTTRSRMARPTTSRAAAAAIIAERAQAVNPPGTFHHPPLGFGPVPLPGQQPDARPFRDRRQVTILGLGVPERSAFRQLELRPPPAGLLLFPGQPFAKRGDEIIVCQLIIAAHPRRDRRLLCAEPSGSVGVIRRSSLSRMWNTSSKISRTARVSRRRLATPVPTSSGP